jgi:CRP-like cAMP-binding protein
VLTGGVIYHAPAGPNASTVAAAAAVSTLPDTVAQGTSSPPSREELAELGLFGALPDGVLDALAQELQRVRVDAGEVLLREGERARELYVVLEGELEVLRHSKGGHPWQAAVLHAGQWVGEMSILDAQPRSATVRALRPSRLLRVTAEDLDRLYRRDLRAYTLVVMNMARELSRRLRVADAMIADFVGGLWDENLGPPRAG